MRRWSTFLKVGWAALVAVLGAMAYVALPRPAAVALLALAGAAVIAGTALYFRERPAAMRAVWPAGKGVKAAA
jgi:predicted membrane channel-forming protein YqfA (hemolysin III family)